MQSSQHYEQLLSAIRRIVRSIDLRSRQLVRSHGLTGPQLLLIKELLAAGSTTVSRLAERVNLSQATVTDILNRLEGRKLIARTRSERDRRCVLIELTDTARQSFETSPPLHADQFASRFTSLQDWEQLQLVASLNRVASMMNGEDIERFADGRGDTLLTERHHQQERKVTRKKLNMQLRAGNMKDL